MKTRFTPGPWRACCPTTAAHYVFADDAQTEICQPLHNEPGMYMYEPLSGTVTLEQRLANAALISAAPDLFAACQEVLSLQSNGLTLPETLKTMLASAISKVQDFDTE